MRTFKWWLCITAGLIACPAYAQTNPGDAQTVDEIVVTARKREESLQRVPVAVTAVSEAVIEERALTELKDIQDIAPNVLFTENTGTKGTSRVYIRGVGENTLVYSADPAVGLYIDGVPLTRPQGSNLGLLDVARVEVLRGPQGTTFGRNTIGGAINFVTNEVDADLSGRLRLKLSNYNGVFGEGVINLPLGETAALRIAGQVNRRDGFVENRYGGDALNDLDNDTVRIKLKWSPFARLQSDFTVDFSRRDEMAVAPQLLYYDATSPLVSIFESVAFARYGVRPFADALDGDPSSGFYPGGGPVRPGEPSIVYTDPVRPQYEIASRPNAVRQRVWGAYTVNAFELTEDLTAKVIGGMRETRTITWMDAFGGAVPIAPTVLEANADEASVEAQLIGTDLFQGRTDFVAGVYYGEVLASQKGTFWLEPEAIAVFINNSSSRDEDQKTRSIAVFANVSHELTSKMTLTAGARWTRDKKDFRRYEYATFPLGTDFGFGPAALPLRPTIGGAPLQIDLQGEWSAWSGTIALQRQWTDQVMTYGSVSRGFRSGGFSAFANSTLEAAPFDPEFVTSYELGTRTTLLEGRLVFNATAFWMDYTDRQLTSLRVISLVPFVSGFVTYNAGSSRQAGVEIEAFARITPSFTVSAAYGLLDAQYEELDGPIVPGSTVESDLRLKLPQTPRTTANIALNYTQTLGARGSIVFHVDGAYRGKTYFDTANSEVIAQDSYVVANARVAWESPDGATTIALWGRNIFDKQYKVDGVDVAGAFASANYGDPQTFGIEISRSFP